MKKWLGIILCLSFLFGTLSGCGDKIVKPIEPSPSETPAPFVVPDTKAYPVDLTDEQLSVFETSFCEQDNYGFLLSNYDDVRDVDMDMVFYTGAGMSQAENSEDIAQAYLTQSGETELYTDYTALTTKQLNEFLLSKGGYSLSDMRGTLSWDYIEKYDAYIHLHGDTNYMAVTVSGGREISADLYEIEYDIPGGWADYDGNFLTGGTVTVNTAGGVMRFVSNSMHG